MRLLRKIFLSKILPTRARFKEKENKKKKREKRKRETTNLHEPAGLVAAVRAVNAPGVLLLPRRKPAMLRVDYCCRGARLDCYACSGQGCEARIDITQRSECAETEGHLVSASDVLAPI